MVFWNCCRIIELVFEFYKIKFFCWFWGFWKVCKYVFSGEKIVDVILVVGIWISFLLELVLYIIRVFGVVIVSLFLLLLNFDVLYGILFKFIW